MIRLWLAGLTAALGAGCAARAEPLDAEGVVVAAGPAAPVAKGSRCSLGLWPAWRQGVNCQLLLRCGGTDLFGGKRVGGYAVCETRDRHFVHALDDKPFDGDPALDLDLPARRIRWRDSHPAATLEIALLEVSERPRR
jgi:hypothetical protein